jgi:hypothetical protein
VNSTNTSAEEKIFKKMEQKKKWREKKNKIQNARAAAATCTLQCVKNAQQKCTSALNTQY